MALPLIQHAGQGLEVKGRRRLGSATEFEGFLEQLSKEIEKKPAGKCVISDLDVSQNKLSTEQFEILFALLAESKVGVMRFRMFGCATINDEVMLVIANYFRGLADGAEVVPREMHLSDCAITSEGFTTFMAAIEETELYPVMAGGKYGQALYLRLENNYIEEAVIQEKVDAGIIRAHKKTDPKSNEAGAKVDLVVQHGGSFQQKQGTPPPPEKAPPPKLIHDRFQEEMTARQYPANAAQYMMGMMQNVAGAWQQGWGSQQAHKPSVLAPRPVQARPAGVAALPAAAAAWNQAGGWQQQPHGWQQPQQQAAGGWPQQAAAAWPQQPRPAAAAWPQQPRPAAAAWQQQQQPRPAAAAWPQQQQPRPGLMQQRPAGMAAVRPGGGFNAFGGNVAAQLGRSATATDRSRTPAGHGARPAAVAAPPKQAPPKAGGLPPPWEEQHSEEYGIPYYWNAETGEALWEKPKF